jgi:ribonuclease HI
MYSDHTPRILACKISRQPSFEVKRVVIYTDGACAGNPGPGGWAALLSAERHFKEISGAEAATTNNRMEMRAAVEALRQLREPCEVDFYTDSEYLRQGITQWVHGWKIRNWLTKAREPVKNQDLWIELDALASRHKITWHWLKGHAGHAQNERCDLLARNAITSLRKMHTAAELKQCLAEFKRGAKAQVDS